MLYRTFFALTCESNSNLYTAISSLAHQTYPRTRYNASKGFRVGDSCPRIELVDQVVAPGESRTAM
jgi:hypothetical protein